MPSEDIYNPNREIEFLRLERAGTPDSDPVYKSLGKVYASREDFRGTQTGPDGEQVFSSQVRYKKRQTLQYTESKTTDDLRSGFGQHAFGSEPFGSSGVPQVLIAGIAVESGDYLRDIQRNVTYQIEGLKEIGDLYIEIYCNREAV